MVYSCLRNGTACQLSSLSKRYFIAFKRSLSLSGLARSCDDLRLRTEGLWAKTPPQMAESPESRRAKKQEVWRQHSDKEPPTPVSSLRAREQLDFNQ